MLMPTYRSGANARLALGKESAFNTPSTTMNDIPKSSFTVPGNYELINNDELRSDPNPVADAKGLQMGEGWSFDAMCTSDVFGLLCYWFFGDYSVTGAADPYSHVFEIDNSAVDSLTAEYGDTQSAIARYDAYYGLYLSQLGLSISKQSELIKVSCGGVGSGKSAINGATPADASPDTYSDLRHSMPGVTIKVDTVAVAYLTSIDLQITRAVYPTNPLDGNLFANGATLGKYEVDCTLTGWRDQADVLYGLDDDAEHVVEIISPRPDGATHDISIKFEEAYIFATEQTSISDDGPAEFSVKVSPFLGNGASNSAIVVTVDSTIADYSAV
jgi:hypothetical protein